MSQRNDDFEVETIVNQPLFGNKLAPTTERYLPEVTWKDADGDHRLRIETGARIGSAQGNDILLSDPSVSRVHARLEVRNGTLWITDLGSRNGTFVARVRVQEAEIPDGAYVRLGGTDLRVSYGAKPEAVSLWPNDRFGPLLGRSTVMREMFRRIAKVAATDSTVLIQGETGTGKELVARAIHEASPRAKAPFIVVDCGAIPRDLMEAELFGHVKGAFTGAIGAREGAIEAADGGTVFFDEFGELPLSLQPKLLRVIESRTIRRVGEAQHRTADVRYIVATHRDLATLVNQGAFREDLYFRVAVVPMHLPSLRERPDDIEQLLRHFLPKDTELDPILLQEVMKRPWLGNVRELRNFADRMIALGPKEALEGPSRGRPISSPPPPSAPPAAVSNATVKLPALADVPVMPPAEFPPIDLDQPFKETRDRWLSHLEREYLRGWLEKTRWNVSAVAEHIGLDRTYVHRLMKKHDLGK